MTCLHSKLCVSDMWRGCRCFNIANFKFENSWTSWRADACNALTMLLRYGWPFFNSPVSLFMFDLIFMRKFSFPREKKQTAARLFLTWTRWFLHGNDLLPQPLILRVIEWLHPTELYVKNCFSFAFRLTRSLRLSSPTIKISMRNRFTSIEFRFARK